MVYSVILLIFRSAFSFKPFFSGFLYSMIIGIQRGIFSSETGLGTGSITSSASNSFHFKNDGYLQMIGVSITTLVVCTITAFIILLSPYQNMNVIDVNGIEIASFAFSYHFSSFGSVLLFLFIFLCSFSTILTGYYDSLISLRFLAFHHNKILKKILIFCTMIMILLSSFLSSFFMWQMVDLFTGILILINLYAIWEMKEKVKNILKYHS
jgi:Na+/alanine symporter